jgi:hypothetical protein
VTHEDQQPAPSLDEDAPEPLRPPATQDERVDSALARLGDTHGRPAAEHVEIFEDVHRRLQDTLGSLDGET